MSAWHAWDWFWFGLGIGALIACYLGRAQYFNGANDGYGYAVDPGCPGYWKAGRYLRKYLRHRWPEVMRGAALDPDSPAQRSGDGNG